MADIATRVKEIIVDKLGVDESEVTPEASFTNDLGADSLDTVELIMEFEKEFDFCFVSNIEIYGRDYCYIDIYYLVDNGGKILVTEVGYDFNV